MQYSCESPERRADTHPAAATRPHHKKWRGCARESSRSSPERFWCAHRDRYRALKTRPRVLTLCRATSRAGRTTDRPPTKDSHHAAQGALKHAARYETAPRAWRALPRSTVESSGQEYSTRSVLPARGRAVLEKVFV